MSKAKGNRQTWQRMVALSLLCALLLPVVAFGADTPGEWYRQEAEQIRDDFKALLSDSVYINELQSSAEVMALLSDWLKALNEHDPVPRVFALPTMEQAAKLLGVGPDIGVLNQLSDVVRRRVELGAFSGMVNAKNMAEGTPFMIATSMTMMDKLAEKPAGFENQLLVYDYGVFAVAVAFRDRDIAIDVSLYPVSRALLDDLTPLE